MLLPITLAPHKDLETRCTSISKVTNILAELGRNMLETCESHSAYGLAANQIGQLVRVLVIKQDKKYILMYNPIILSQSMTRRGNMEACLSFPGKKCLIKRPINVKVRYLDINNKLKMKYLEGWDAVVLMHELDHLNGLTFETTNARR